MDGGRQGETLHRRRLETRQGQSVVKRLDEVHLITFGRFTCHDDMFENFIRFELGTSRTLLGLDIRDHLLVAVRSPERG